MKNKQLTIEDVIDMYRKRQGLFPRYSDQLRNELYRRVSDLIEVYAISLTKEDRELASEIKSQVLVAVLEKEADILEKISNSYLRVMTRYTYLNMRKAQKARENNLDLHTLELLTETEPEETTNKLEGKDLKSILDLVDLSPVEQKTIMMYYGDSYNVREIAEELGQSKSYVKAYLFRIRKKLSHQLQAIKGAL